MVNKGTLRNVQFPAGNWKGDDGSLVKGPTIKEIKVMLDRLPWFHMVKNKK